MKYLFLLLAAISLIACKKSRESGNLRDALVDRKWKWTSAHGGLNGVTTTPNLLTRTGPYDTDDYRIYYSNGTLELNDNIIRDPRWSTPVLDTGTWELKDDILTSDDFPYPVRISLIASDTMTLARDKSNGTQELFGYNLIP